MPTPQDSIKSIKALEGKLITVQQVRTLAEAALARYDATADPEEKERIQQEIVSLEQIASQATSQSRPWNKNSKISAVVVAIAVLVISGILIRIMANYVSDGQAVTLRTIEGMRPILVIAAVISAIFFGGALLLGSLFSSEGAFEDRFRRAREIFLVFSGVFGTVLGFYFGAGESRSAQLSVDATLQGAEVVAYAVGGTPPYQVTISYGDNQSKAQATSDGFARFAFNKDSDNLIPLKITVNDSKNVQGVKPLALSASELGAAGWKVYASPTVTTTTTTEPTNPPDTPPTAAPPAEAASPAPTTP